MNNRIVLILLLATGGCATTAPPSQDYAALYDGRPGTVFGTELPTADAAEAIRRGDHALARGQADRALWFYIRSLDHDSSSAVAFTRIGALHERRGNLALAARAYEEAAMRAPDNVAIVERLATILLNQRDLDRARTRFESIADSPDAGWRTHNGIGVLADLEGDHMGAAAHFRRALEQEPHSAQILNNLGYSYYLYGAWDLARSSLEGALAVEPANELALRNLALLEARTGAPEKALELLLLITTEQKALNDVGYICMLEGQHAEAHAYLRRAIDASPSYYALAHRNLERNAELARKAKLASSSPRSALPARRPSQVERAAPDRASVGGASGPAQRPETALSAPAGAVAVPDAELATAITPTPDRPAEIAHEPHNATLPPRPRATQVVAEPQPTPLASLARSGQQRAPHLDASVATDPGASRPDPEPELVTPSRGPAQVAEPVDAQDAPDASSASEGELYLRRWVSASVLKVREQASLQAAAIGSLNRGRVVRVLRHEGDWAYVLFWDTREGVATRKGWVHADYLADQRIRT